MGNQAEVILANSRYKNQQIKQINTKKVRGKSSLYNRITQNLEFRMKFSHTEFTTGEVQIYAMTNRTWFESDYDFYTLLTSDNGRFLPVEFHDCDHN